MTRPTLAQLALVLAAFVAAAGLVAASMPRWRAYQAAGTTAVALANLRIVAVRGSCWIQVRDASGHGRIRFAGSLPRGGGLHLRGPRLWVRLVAAGNVDVTLNGRPQLGLSTGTVDLVVSPSGLAPASAPSSLGEGI